jgi:hypothetical protein
MTKLLISTTAIILVSLSAPAQAVESLPAEMLGVWCYNGAKNGDNTYVRNQTCEDTRQLKVRSNGFSGYELDCRIVKTNLSIYYLYNTARSFEAKCIGDGNRFTWKGMFGKRHDNGLDLVPDKD